MFLFRLCVNARAIFVLWSGTNIAKGGVGGATTHPGKNSKGPGPPERLWETGHADPGTRFRITEPARRGLCLCTAETNVGTRFWSICNPDAPTMSNFVHDLLFRVEIDNRMGPLSD